MSTKKPANAPDATNAPAPADAPDTTAAPVAPSPVPVPTPERARARRDRSPLALAAQAGEMWIVNAGGRCVQIKREMGEIMIRQGDAVAAPSERIAEELGVALEDLGDPQAVAPKTMQSAKALKMMLGARRRADLVNVVARYDLDADATSPTPELIDVICAAILAGKVPDNLG